MTAQTDNIVLEIKNVVHEIAIPNIASIDGNLACYRYYEQWTAFDSNDFLLFLLFASLFKSVEMPKYQNVNFITISLAIEDENNIRKNLEEKFQERIR